MSTKDDSASFDAEQDQNAQNGTDSVHDSEAGHIDPEEGRYALGVSDSEAGHIDAEEGRHALGAAGEEDDDPLASYRQQKKGRENSEAPSGGGSATIWSLQDIDVVFPIADIHGQPAHYHSVQEDEGGTTTNSKSKEANGEVESSTQEPSRCYALLTAIEVFKYAYSFTLLVLCVVVVLAAIFQRQSVGTADMGIHPAAAFCVFWFLIFWLATMEGGQGALVGLRPIDKSLYAESHPRALKSTALAHRGDNMERFIVGRQFLVVLVLFITNMMASAAEGAAVLGFPSILNEIFLASGFALILITVTVGQLTAQVNAASSMLDFINNYFMLFTVYVSLGIEFSGLLHSVYVVQIFFAKVTGTDVTSKEPPRSAVQNLFFWLRAIMSVVVLGFCFAVTLAALFEGKTKMGEDYPAAASIVVFFILMAFAGMMEGMQIALFAVVNLPGDELQKHAMAHKVCQITFKGHNLQAFLIGRQVCVTLCMFVVAQITSLDYTDGDDNLWGVSDGLQNFFNTGLLGAVITTVCASLIWRIIASSFPVAFLSNPLIYLIVRLCLVLEMTGICSSAWLLSYVQKKIMSYQPDVEYIGTPSRDRHTDLELHEEYGIETVLKSSSSYST